MLKRPSFVEKIPNEIERKALEIILMNKKYESLASDSEDEIENFVQPRV
jgi:hypothetical protein